MPINRNDTEAEMHGSSAATMDDIQLGSAAPRETARGIGAAADGSVRLNARLAGGLWLMVIITSMFAFFVQAPLIVRGDAAATAANLLASETAYRLGYAANQLAGIFYLGVTVLLYALLKPVGRSAAMIAASLGVAGVAVGAASSLLQLAPLAVLNDAAEPGALAGTQQQALAYTFVGLDAPGFALAMLFFGVQCILMGILITRSTFLPRVLGVLLGIGGASYVVSSLANLVAPAFGARLAPFVIPAALIGEGSLVVWLMAKGVDVRRWQERAAGQ